jgi:hypothetical protein
MAGHPRIRVSETQGITFSVVYMMSGNGTPHNLFGFAIEAGSLNWSSRGFRVQVLCQELRARFVARPIHLLRQTRLELILTTDEEGKSLAGEYLSNPHEQEGRTGVRFTFHWA